MRPGGTRRYPGQIPLGTRRDSRLMREEFRGPLLEGADPATPAPRRLPRSSPDNGPEHDRRRLRTATARDGRPEVPPTLTAAIYLPARLRPRPVDGGLRRPGRPEAPLAPVLIGERRGIRPERDPAEAGGPTAAVQAEIPHRGAI